MIIVSSHVVFIKNNLAEYRYIRICCVDCCVGSNMTDLNRNFAPKIIIIIIIIWFLYSAFPERSKRCDFAATGESSESCRFI